MILKFADLETLRLALVSGAIPAAVSQTPVMAGFDDQEALWIDTPANLPRAAQTEVRRHGVQICKSVGNVPLSEYTCWAQLLPLRRTDILPDQLGQNPVLFVVHETEGLSQLAIEILRLGNDRQSYRWLDSTEAGQPVGILRVVAPPYYSLLRAIDRIGREKAPEAFVEKAPRVWVQFGYDHPLSEQLKAPEGRLVLLRAPDRWEQLEEAPYRDVYEVAEFPLPEQPLRHTKSELKSHLNVPLSLKPSSDPNRAELWVLTDNPIETLNAFVQNADDEILHRLSFAVGKGKDGATTIVLRTRQSKQEPPVLVLNARSYRAYQKLPNLFLPVGSRLHPPLRRDRVRQLLADDASQVVWLAPGEDAGTFAPESLAEDAFRPLWDWVDYILDHEKEPLQAWIQASHFDFELFICEDEQRADRPKKTPGEDKKEKKGDRKGSTPGGNLPGDDPNKFEPHKKDRAETLLIEEEDLLSAAPVEPSLLQKRLKELEEAFVACEGGLDAPERIAMWPEMAQIHSDLGHVEDASLCWGNALWTQNAIPAEAAWRWFRAEASNLNRGDGGNGRARHWTYRAANVARANRDVDGADLDRLLGTTEPNTSDLRALAAYLVFAARKDTPPPALIERLNPIQRFLEQHERQLPLRFVWLAWTHLSQLSKGDVLTLARARDRILERLFAHGMRPEQELPSFLRFAGQPTSQRFRAVRTWMTHLAELAQVWVRGEGTTAGPTPMGAYIDLIFGFGLARLGEADTARQMSQRAHAALSGNDVSLVLLQAYEYRIHQALEGKPHAGPLPADHVEYLTHLDRMPRYVVDRLRQHSRILEPNEKIDPYRYWGGRISELDRALAELVDLTDRAEIQRRINALLKEQNKGARAAENRVRILRAALELAPRISEDFAREMLEKVKEAYDALPEATDQPALMLRALFLETALSVVAHFDRVEYVPIIVKRFEEMLTSQKGDRAIAAMESLAGSCFKGLRKLGMRDEIDKILTRMRDIVLEGQDLASMDPSKMTPAALRALLHVAAGWYFFGRDRQGDEVVAKVRQALFRDEIPAKEKTQVACVYAATVGQAPVETAQKRLEELFQKLANIRDTYTTNMYYSLSQLDVVEAVVLAVVSDDFTLGTNARRWLDDDEYLVRKRIHRDMRQTLEKH